MSARSGPPEFGFQRARRLPDSNAFAAVLDGGCRTGNQLFSVFAAPNRQPLARLGVTVSRKVSRKAVVRNRIKRCVREAFRQQSGLSGLDVVVIARPAAALSDNVALATSLQHQWVTIEKRCKES